MLGASSGAALVLAEGKKLCKGGTWWLASRRYQRLAIEDYVENT
jgi:hypothetical protein